MVGLGNFGAEESNMDRLPNVGRDGYRAGGHETRPSSGQPEPKRSSVLKRGLSLSKKEMVGVLVMRVFDMVQSAVHLGSVALFSLRRNRIKCILKRNKERTICTQNHPVLKAAHFSHI